LLWLFLALIGGAFLAACLGRVEVNGRGRGILRPPGGVRMLVAQVNGTIGAVEVHSGQQVEKGKPLLRIDAPQVRVQLLEAQRPTQAIRQEFQSATRLQDLAFAHQTRSLASRAAKLNSQIASQGASVARFERQLQASLILEEAGILSRTRADEAREALGQAQQQLCGHELGLEQIAQEQACLDHQRQEHLWQRGQTIQNAATREESLALLLEQTVIQAPQDGVVEALLVKPGEVVQPGQVLGKLLSLGAPLEVVAFLAEKDRAFVRTGDEALLEMDQLPYAEYGTIRARVRRISEDLASPFELREALGDTPSPALPSFRVELRLVDARAAERARVKLRPGMLANVRFTLRRQPLITLVLEPLQKWLQ
jgi:multidrug resistance efflux pump